MLITAIKQTSPGRLTVTLEDEREIKTTLGVVTDLRLFSGRELDEGALEELERESRRALTREKALEYLSRRAMSRKELEKKLTDKGYDEEDAANCAAWLAERGLIDDAGLRGLRVGGAQVSEKHTGFIVNTGDATAADVLALMEEVKARVYALFGVKLEPEVRILGENA